MLPLLDRRHLKVDYVVRADFVKYVDITDPEGFNDDNGPHLSCADILSLQPFQPLRGPMLAFATVVLPRLRTQHRSLSLQSFLPVVALRRVGCVSSHFRRGLRAGPANSIRLCTDALRIRWWRVVRLFSRSDMEAWDPIYASTVCYLALDALVRPSGNAPPDDANGWSCVSFQLGYGPTVLREGWIHPGIVDWVPPRTLPLRDAIDDIPGNPQSS